MVAVPPEGPVVSPKYVSSSLAQAAGTTTAPLKGGPVKNLDAVTRAR